MWGEVQADRYLELLEAAVRKLIGHPSSGRRRDELRPGYWSTRAGHHVVFYTFTSGELRVRRVLHEAMDQGRHL